MSTRASWRLLVVESLLTTRLVTPIIVVFCLSIGLNLVEIGTADIVSSLVYLALNVPIGWAADRVSRKAFNLLGDIVYGLSMVALGLSTSPTHVIAAYVMMALGFACTQGADAALLEAHCEELGINYSDASKRLSQARCCFEVVAFFTCSVLVAQFGMKTTILIASVPYFIGTILSYFILEIGARKEVDSAEELPIREKFTTELKEMAEVIWYALVKNRRLSWLIIAYTTAAGMTDAITILVGPMLLLVGGQASHVALAYTVLVVMALIGGEVSRKAFKARDVSTLFIWACVVALIAMSVLSLHLSIWTVGLFLVVHVAKGWLCTTMPPLIQKTTPKDIQSTVTSLSSSLVIGACMAGIAIIALVESNYGLRWGIAINVILFLPFTAIAAWGLYRTTPAKEQEDHVAPCP